MSGSEHRTLRDWLARLGWAAQVGLVAAAFFGAALVTAPAAFALSGAAGLAAVAVAAAVCLLGAIPALALGELFRGPSAALFALVLGMLARTMIPLAVGVALHLAVPSLAAAGMIFYLLGFYLVGLAVETALLLSKVAQATASARKAV